MLSSATLVIKRFLAILRLHVKQISYRLSTRVKGSITNNICRAGSEKVRIDRSAVDQGWRSLNILSASGNSSPGFPGKF
jgi:hypothetical protein